MEINEIMVFNMLIQADIFVDGHGTTEEDKELFRSAIMKYYQVDDNSPEEALERIEGLIEDKKKELVKLYRSKIQDYLNDTQQKAKG